MYFDYLYLTNGSCELKLLCGVFYLGDSYNENWCTLEKGPQRYVYMKIFFSSCQYSHGVAHWLTWPHNTLPCVLITVYLCVCLCVCLCAEFAAVSRLYGIFN